jgi:hypothetical protein
MIAGFRGEGKGERVRVRGNYSNPKSKIQNPKYILSPISQLY